MDTSELRRELGYTVAADTGEKQAQLCWDAAAELERLEREVEFKTNELGKYILRTANAEALLSELAAIIDNKDGVLSPFDGNPELLEQLRLATR